MPFKNGIPFAPRFVTGKLMAPSKIKNHDEQHAHVPISFYRQTSYASFIMGEKYYQYEKGKSWVEEAIIEVNQKNEKKKKKNGRGREATKVHHSLIDASRLPFLRKIRTCGKSACPFEHCRKGRSQTPYREKVRGEVKQMFPAICASEECSEPEREFPTAAQIGGRHTLLPALMQKSGMSAITSQTSSLCLPQSLTESTQLQTRKKLMQMYHIDSFCSIFFSQIICF